MSKVVKMLKNNLFFAAIILAYIVLSFFSPNFAIQGIKNSGYYMLTSQNHHTQRLPIGA